MLANVRSNVDFACELPGSQGKRRKRNSHYLI